MAGGVTRRTLFRGGAAAAALAALPGTVLAADRSTGTGNPRSAHGGNEMNIVLVAIDTLRPDHVGAYGGTLARTPNLDAFARTATRFTRPYAEALPTIQVRRSAFTGLRTYPMRHWEPVTGTAALPGWGPIPGDQTTLAELLSPLGYTSMLVADNAMLFRPEMNFQRGFSGFTFVRGTGEDHHRPGVLAPADKIAAHLPAAQQDSDMAAYVAQALANAEGWQSEEDWPAARTFADAADAVGLLREHQPFFIAADTFEVHEPWLAPPGYVDAYSDYRGVEPIQPEYGEAGYLSYAQLDRMKALYAAETTFTDRHFGRLLDALTRHGLLDNTIVVVYSDHGMLLGEHDLTGKPSYAMYPELTDIIMMIRHPTQGHGTTSPVPVGTHDLAPTILAAADVGVDGKLDGADALDPGSAVADRTYQTSMWKHTVWVRDDRYTLIAPEYGATRHLYDHRADPAFAHDLAHAEPGRVRTMFTHALDDADGHIPHYAG